MNLHVLIIIHCNPCLSFYDLTPSFWDGVKGRTGGTIIAATGQTFSIFILASNVQASATV